MIQPAYLEDNSVYLSLLSFLPKISLARHENLARYSATALRPNFSPAS